MSKRKNETISGQKNSSIKYFTDELPKDIKGDSLPYSVAIVARCIAFYRKRMRPLQSVWLRPEHFREFDYWARSFMIEKEADSNINNLTFDGVFIKEGSKIQKDDIVWDFYPQGEA